MMGDGFTTDDGTPDYTDPEDAVVEITDAADGTTATQSVVNIAAKIGFETEDRADLKKAAEDIAQALIDYSGGGTLTIKPLSDDGRPGIRLETRMARPDDRQGKATFMTDPGTEESLGFDLPAMHQPMDRITATTADGPAGGTRLVADRWLEPGHERPKRIPVSIGAASMAISRDQPNGDSFIVSSSNETTVVGVIDGLGHGPRAHEASNAARNYIESHVEKPLESIFRGADKACSGTRGVVMALAKFDWTAETIRFANVGNINVRVAGPEWTGFIVRRGVIGGNNPGASVVTRDWHPSYTFVLSSDGISTGWGFADIRQNANGSAGAIANRLLDQYGKSDDDATAIVVTQSND